MIRIFRNLFSAFGCAFFLFSANVGADTASAIQWLSTQSATGGSYASTADISPPFSSTIETLDTFYTIGETAQAGIPAALQFINAESYHNTKNLAHKIITNIAAGNNVSAWVTELKAMQNADGGYGELLGYDSSILDTAIALQAFAVAGVSDMQLIGTTISYLLAHQNAGGGFALSSSNENSVYATALVSIALQKYLFNFSVGTQIEAASTYLFNKQASSGGWNSDWETAAVLLAVVPVTTDASRYADAVANLQATQLADGSWGNSVFTTALALRALHSVANVKLPVNPTQGILTGRVVDNGTGLPLAGVTVTLDQAATVQTVTASNGVFELTQVTPGQYTVRYQLAGYYDATQNVGVQAGQVLSLGTVPLLSRPDTGIVAGIVTDSSTGAPIAGATIQVTNAAGQISATSNAAGSYSVAVAPGAVSLMVSATGYDAVTASGNLTAGNTLNFSPALHAAGTTPTDPSVTVKGIVADGDSGQPLSGATVQIAGTALSGTTATDGTFTISGITAGELTIDVSSLGYQTVRYTAVAPQSAVVDLGTVRLPHAVVTATSTFSGIVTDADTGAPIAGADITIAGGIGGAVSATDGSYIIEGLTGTQFTISASAVGYLSASGNAQLQQPGSVTMNFPLQHSTASSFDITTVTTADPSYPALSQVQLDTVLANTGSVTKSVRLYIKVVNANNEIVAQQPSVRVPLGGDPALALVTVDAGTQMQTVVDWNTARYTPGTYQIIVQAFDSQTGQLLAERGTSIDILLTDRIGGSAQFDPPIAQLAAKQPINILANVMNQGNVPIGATSLTARVSLKNQGYQQRTDLVTVETVAQGQGINNPKGTDVDSSGNIYVANYAGGTVSKITPDGSVTEFASGFTNPVDLDIDTQGNIYVLNLNNSIIRLGADSTRTAIPTGINSQQAIEALADGRILVTRQNAVYAVLLDGTVTPLLSSGGLSNPQGMVLDSQGNVFIANRSGNSIVKFSNGTLSTYVTGINQPYGIDIDGQGNLYVTSYSDNSLLKITPTGTVTTVASGLSGPYDVKVAPDGNLVVSNSNANTVVSITADGTISTLVEGKVNSPRGAVYDANGNLYVSNYSWNNIVRFAPDGTSQTVLTGVTRPTNIALASDGGFDVLENARQLAHYAPDGTRTPIGPALSGAYDMIPAQDGNGFILSEAARISRIDAAGQLTTYLDSQLITPRSMRQKADGTLYVLSGSGYIVRIDPDGTVTRVASGLNNPYGLALDADGNLYTSEYSRREVLKIDPTGNVAVIATTTFSPGSVAVDNQGQVFVVPYANNQVYVIDSTGTVTPYATLTYGLYGLYGDDMLFDAQGNLWSSHRIYTRVSKLAPDGTKTSYSTGTSPYGITSDGQGGIYASLGTSSYNYIVHYDNSGTRTTSVYENGLGSGHTFIGVAIDASGKYFGITNTGILNRYNSDGTLDVRFASLQSPRGLTYADDGSLIVLSTGNKTLVRITSPNQLPVVVALGTYTYITNPGNGTYLLANQNRVWRFNPTTSALTMLPNDFRSTAGLAAGKNGELAVSDTTRNEVVLYGAADTITNTLMGISAPQGISFDLDGTLYIANGNSYNIILKLLPDGRMERFTSSSISGRTTYLFADPNGNIIASSGAGSRIYEFTKAGTTSRIYSSDRVYGIARDLNGNLLGVSSSGALMQHATNGANYTKLASGIASAQDIETDTFGAIYIADKTSNLINILNSDNSLSLVAADTPTVSSIAFNAANDMYFSYNGREVGIIRSNGTRESLPISAVMASNQVSGLAFDSAGNLYASDSNIHAILRLLQSATTPPAQPGDIVFTATTPIGDLNLDSPAIAVDFGDWTPPDSGDYQLTITADNGQTSSELANTLHVGPQANANLSLAQTSVMPGDRSVAAYLNIFGADSTSITQIDASGVSLAAASGTSGRAIGADSAGNIYAADSNRIVKIAADGVVSNFVTGIRVGNGLAVDSHDNIYAVYGTTVLKIAPDATVITLASLRGTVSAVATDYNDTVYTVDSSNTLSRINANGSVDVITQVGLNSPRGLTIDAFGNFYVLNVNNIIVRISPDGKSSSQYFKDASFEYEGVNVTADCSNNLLFAPTRLAPFKYSGEENIIVQLVGDTGEVQQVLYGPSIDPAMSDMDVLFYDRLGKRLLIWTDLNNGKIFSFPMMCGGIDVESHLVTRADVDISSVDPAPIGVTDRADGTREYTWLLSQVDNRGQSIQLNTLFKGLSEGETRPLAQEAFLIFNNSFSSTEPVRVDIPIPSLHASTEMGIAPSLDATSYGPAATVNISTNITNGSDLSFDGTLELSIADLNGVTVETLPSISVTGLIGLASQLYPSQWNTGTIYTGNYKLVARLLNATGASVAQGEVQFAINPGTDAGGTAVINSTIHTDRPVYQGWDHVQIEGRVRNSANNSIQDPSTAEVTVTKPGGTVVYSTSTAVSSLYPSSYHDILSDFNLVDAGTGQYTVVLLVKDVATGTELTRSQTSFQVEHIATQGLIGSVELSTRQLSVGDTIDCTESVTNIGTAAVTGATVYHVLANTDTGTVIHQSQQVVDLPGGGVLSTVHSEGTTGLTPGGYICIVQVDVSGTVKDLAAAGFQLNEPPIKLSSEFTPGTRGRLLVLLDDGSACAHESHQSEDKDEHDEVCSTADANAPTLEQKRAHLEGLLGQSGWTYTLVTQRTDFIREMHSGGYTVYALLGKTVAFEGEHEDEFEHELREAVFRGEGLVVAALKTAEDDVLGIELKGIRKATMLELPPSVLHTGGQFSFGKTVRVRPIELEGATLAGRFPEITTSHSHDEDGEHHDHTADGAVTYFDYGNGHTVYVGFDLLSQATSSPSTSAFDELLLAALSHVHPTELPAFGASVVPVNLSILNQGMAIQGRALISVSSGAMVVNADPTQIQADGSLAVPFNLDVDQGVMLPTIWIRLPLNQSFATITAQIQTGTAQDYTDYDTIELGIPVSPTPPLTTVIAQLSALTNQDKHYGKALKQLYKANDALLSQNFGKALMALLKAADELNETDNRDLRTSIDLIIRDTAARLPDGYGSTCDSMPHEGLDKQVCTGK